MKSFALITALATAAAAIDLHLDNQGGCRGGGWVCRNWNPNTCCSVNAGTYFPSVSFRAIPTNWNIQCRGHAGPNCGSIREQADSHGRVDVCLGNGPFGGSGYGFNNKKMIRGADVRGIDAEAADCVKPDIMYLADGTTFNYTAILEAKLPEVELIQLNKAGASVAEIPDSYLAFKLEETIA